jgi:ATP-dependent DNA ligase
VRLSFYPPPVRIRAPATGRRLTARTKVGPVRLQIIKDGSDVRLYSKSGADYTYRASPLDFTAFALKGYDQPVQFRYVGLTGRCQ